MIDHGDDVTNTENKMNFLKVATAKFGPAGTFKNAAMLEFIDTLDIPRKDWAWVFDSKNKVSRALYRLPVVKKATEPESAPTKRKNAQASVVQMAPTAEIIAITRGAAFDPNANSTYDHAVVPIRDPFYIPFGEFKDIEAIIRSGDFFPVFISGMSGNGKTVMVEQAASRANRLMVRIQMSRETDEDDLIGGFRLICGETKFMKGPVLRAMELGALLLIDEADRADPGKVMCLQGILEGKPYYVKKTGEVVTAARGFNVMVTANTKGKGSDDGRYVAAGVLDDAWLERFPITIEQTYPTAKTETRILISYLCHERDCSSEDTKFVDHLVTWASIIRKTFEEGAIDEVISTRRLVHIIRTYRMFNDRLRAINLCINRFDDDTKASFIDLYTKVDPTVVPETPAMPVNTGVAPSTDQV